MSKPLCDCDSCSESRAWRVEYPQMRLTSMEQWHNLGVAQRELNAAVMSSLPIARFKRWVRLHPRQAIAVQGALALAILAIFIFADPVQH